jgi:recombination protein RecA
MKEVDKIVKQIKNITEIQEKEEIQKITNKIVDQAINETKKKKEKPIEKKRLLTGSTLRDLVLAGEKDKLGIPTGVIWNSIGDSSAGKTFESCELIATNKKIYKDKFRWNYDNCEGGMTLDSQKLYGFDIITDKSLISHTVEELFINVNKFIKELKSDELGCYVVDSLDALVSSEVVERGEDRIKAFKKGKEFDAGSYLMGKQKYLSQEFLPIIKPLIETSNCLLIIISQEKEKIGVTFGSKSTRAGGKALQFFSHFESWLARSEKLEITKKGEKRVVGIRNKMRFTKARNARPFRDSYATIYFDYGISDIDSNVDFLFGLLTDSGNDKAIKDFKGVEYKDQIFKSKKELIAYIIENNFEEEIKQLVINRWEEIEDSVKIERRSKY